MQIRDTLAFLLGDWDLRRSIFDEQSGTYGLLEGSAEFRAREPIGRSGTGGDASEAGYREAGQLRFGTAITRASRNLGYSRTVGGAVMIYFADGTPYVDLDLRTGAWQSNHPCVEDLYEITTIVVAAHELREEWRVTGPTKRYNAVTTLTRKPPLMVTPKG